MSSQVYRERYLAALEVAHSQLEQLTLEFETLQLRKGQIENAVGALEPFLRTQSTGYEPRHREPLHVEPAYAAPEPEVAQPVLRAVPAPVPESIAPPAFSPVSDSKVELDPLQSRINRALGLAVA